MNIRKVHTVVKCHDCGGTGRYYHHGSDRTFPHCYKCNSTGMARLEFIETEIQVGQTDASMIRWHTPVREWWNIREVPKTEQLPESQPTPWEPNQEGKCMEPYEVAQCFNEAETFFKERPAPYTGDWYCSGYYYDFDYSLYLGESDPKYCDLCGKETNGEPRRHGCHRDLMAWTAIACVECARDSERGLNSPASIFDRFPSPEYLAAHPAIQEWHARHQGEHRFIEDYRAKRKAWAQG